MHSRRFSTLPAIGILTVIYFIVGKLSLQLAFVHPCASPVWPPAGIALAALVVCGYRTWPAIFLGAFLVNVTTAGNIGTSLCIATGNTLEAVCGAWLVNQFAGGTRIFDRAQDVFKFALAVMVSTAVSPTFGVTSLAVGGLADWANYRAIWGPLSWPRKTSRFLSRKLLRPCWSLRPLRLPRAWRRGGALRRLSSNRKRLSKRRIGQKTIFWRCFRMNFARH